MDAVNNRILVLRLLEAGQQDIFATLCHDIVSVASGATTEREAVGVAVTRTWRWHRLLRGGASGKLSREEQMGLMGELLVLERVLLPVLGPPGAVMAWTGPFDSPKDFEIGPVHLESKARRSGAAPTVSISSEDQLDASASDALFLHVLELSQSARGGRGCRQCA